MEEVLYDSLNPRIEYLGYVIHPPPPGTILVLFPRIQPCRPSSRPTKPRRSGPQEGSLLLSEAAFPAPLSLSSVIEDDKEGGRSRCPLRTSPLLLGVRRRGRRLHTPPGDTILLGWGRRFSNVETQHQHALVFL